MRQLCLLLATFTILSFFTACDSSETYADKLKKERKAINRFIDEHNIKVVTTYPENGVFAENEYFLEPVTGTYIHVVDSGNGRRVSITDRTDVLVRYSGALRLASSDTTVYENTSAAQIHDYISFTYGKTATYTETSTNNGYSNYNFKSLGMVVPLEYVGDSAIVKLIVPFNSGSGMQSSYYEPVYLGMVRYAFELTQE